MDPLICAVLALAVATMRNGSTETLDAVVYTLAFWAFLAFAVALLLS